MLTSRTSYVVGSFAKGNRLLSQRTPKTFGLSVAISQAATVFLRTTYDERRATKLASSSHFPPLLSHVSPFTVAKTITLCYFLYFARPREMRLTFSQLSTYMFRSQDFHRLWKSLGRAGSP